MASSATTRCWCYPLERVQAENRTNATLLDLSELPTDYAQLEQRFPGLCYRIKQNGITTNYALITSHAKIPGSDHLREWRFSSEEGSCTLVDYISGVISCCGKDSFVEPGDTAVVQHHERECNLGLNFTLLFLNDSFKEKFLTQNVHLRPNMISQSDNDICTIEAALCDQNTPLQDSGAANVTASAVESLTDTHTPGTPIASLHFGLVICSSSCIKEVNIIPVTLQTTVGLREVTQTSCKLTQDIIKFDMMKSIGYKRVNETGSSSHLTDVGMPLVCIEEGKAPKLVGLVTKDGKAMPFASLFWILEGRPSACLSLLKCKEMRRLWPNKWSHLLLPYIKQNQMPPKAVLAILIHLPANGDGIIVNPRDSIDTRVEFLEILKVLFTPFSKLSEEEITAMTSQVCAETSVNFETFRHRLTCFCSTLLSLIDDCCHYTSPPTPEVVRLVRTCFESTEATLNYKHKEGIVERILCTKDLRQKLLSLREMCCKSKDWSDNSLIAIQDRHSEYFEKKYDRQVKKSEKRHRSSHSGSRTKATKPPKGGIHPDSQQSGAEAVHPDSQRSSDSDV